MAQNPEVELTQSGNSDGQITAQEGSRSPEVQAALNMLREIATSGPLSPGAQAQEGSAPRPGSESPRTNGQDTIPVTPRDQQQNGRASDTPAATPGGDRVREVEGGKKERFERPTPLSAFERSLANGLMSAVDSGNLGDTQAMLDGISRLSPETQQRVLGAFKSQMENKDPAGLTHVSWESGTSSNGNAFLRLHVARNNDHSKSSGQYHVMMGSDGMNASFRTQRWNDQPNTISPQDGLNTINGLIVQAIRMQNQGNHRNQGNHPTESMMRRQIENFQGQLRPGQN